MIRRSTRRRETPSKMATYWRRVLSTYLHRPPLWVYLVELSAAVTLVSFLLLGYDSEVVSVLLLLWSEWSDR